jgi:hypothetical protein
MHPELTESRRPQSSHGRARPCLRASAWLATALLCAPLAAVAQIVGNNSYARMLSSSSTLIQNSMSTIISQQARTNQQLRQLSGGQGTAPQAPAGTGAAAAAGHLPISATSFVPLVPGHPMFDQYMASVPLTPQDQATIRQHLAQTLQNISTFDPNVPVVPNNIASSVAFAIVMARSALANGVQLPDAVQARYLYVVNDRLAMSPTFATMPPMQMQNLSDTLLFEGTMIRILFQAGPQARAQCLQLAHTVLQQVTGSPNGPDF